MCIIHLTISIMQMDPTGMDEMLARLWCGQATS